MGIALSAENCIAHAMEMCGLDDFGGRTFEEGLGVLVESLNENIDFPEAAAGYFQSVIEQLLVNRLQVVRLVKDHPRIEEERIEKPIFIVGLPRSGTTILHTLLALDPASRYLRNFETAGAVCPPPELLPSSPDPRIQSIHDATEGFYAMAPELRGINGLNFMALGTAECQNLMAHEFVHMGWSCGSSLFSHGSWVCQCDKKEAYRWHKRLLQVFQWKLPNERWVLKAPIHLFGLDILLQTYPDARVIFTHRNPLDAMVSGISMVYRWTRFTAGKADWTAIAKWYPEIWTEGLRRALRVKEDLDDTRCFDLSFETLSHNPVSSIGDAYDHFGIPFGKTAGKRMRIWLKDNPRSQFGTHSYSSPDALPDPEKERERFAFYRAEFYS
jgi:hypothetical protein